MKVKEESEKPGLKLKIHKLKFMAYSPFTSWQIDEKIDGIICISEETDTNFTFVGSKITADSDCRHEIKRCLLIGRKTMTNIDSILNPERWYGVGGGRGVHVWELMYTHGGFMSMYSKTNTVL